MSRADPNKSNFSGGEFDPLFQGRVDHQRYDTGLKLCTNWIPTLQGSAIRRPGGRALGGYGLSMDMIPFNAVGGDSFWLVRTGEGPTTYNYDIYKDRVRVGGVSFLGIPSSYVQVNDTLFVTSERFGVQSVTRLSDSDWRLNAESLTNYDLLVRAPMFGISAASAGSRINLASHVLNVTLTKNASNHVTASGISQDLIDRLLLFSPFGYGGGANDRALPVLVVFEDSVSSSYYLSLSSGVLVDTAGTPVVILGDVLALLYNVYDVGDITRFDGADVLSNSKGQLNFTAGRDEVAALVTSAHANFTDLVSQLQAGTDLDLISGYPVSFRIGLADPIGESLNNGALFRRLVSSNYFPNNVDLYDNRLVLSGSLLSPAQIDLSVTDDYTNFTIIDDSSNPIIFATSSISKNVASESDDSVVWTQNTDDGLYIGCYGGVWLMKPSNDGSVVTNRDSAVRRISRFGCKPGSNVLSVGDSIIYIDRSGRTLREVVKTQDGYASSDLNLLARHMIDGGVDRLAVTYLPQQVIWCCGGGNLYGMTYQRSVDGISVGWHRHTIFGGENVVKVEMLETDVGYELGVLTDTDTFFTLNVEDEDLYFDVLYDTGNGGSFDFGVLGSVDVVSDGVLSERNRMVSGSEALGGGLFVGKSYQSDLQLLRFEAGARAGTAIGKQRRAQRMAFLLHNSASFLFGRTFDKLQRVIFRDPDDISNQLVPLFSGVKTVSLSGGFSYDEEYCLRADGVRGCNVLNIAPQMKTEERQ